MADVRIKDLSAADGQLDKFDDFEFIADVPDVDASINVKSLIILNYILHFPYHCALMAVVELTTSSYFCRYPTSQYELSG